MTDKYAQLVGHGIGKQVATRVGLPRPPRLRRYETGQQLLEGPAVVSGIGDAPLAGRAAAILRGWEADVIESDSDTTYTGKIAAIVFDASAARTLDQLETLRAVCGPAVKALGGSGRLIILAAEPEEAGDAQAAATQQALEGIMRSIGKELRYGATANLLRVDQEAVRSGESADRDVLAGPLRFLCSSRSAYVSGQPLQVRAHQVAPVDDWHTPLDGKTAVITGAARGIGARIAAVFARAGAHVIAVDLPAAGEALSKVANDIGAVALQVDITSDNAGERIAQAVARTSEHLDVIVHNAGITRDKLFVNTDASRWGSVIDINLAAQFRINAVLLDPATRGGLADGGRIVAVASTSGIGGNRGQANYAASKAGVIGMVRQLSKELADRDITANAVAPGFIETEMTSKIPLGTREVGRRINSLMQGGLPVDVGETIAFFAEPGSAGVTGQVLRVCGQSQLGA